MFTINDRKSRRLTGSTNCPACQNHKVITNKISIKNVLSEAQVLICNGFQVMRYFIVACKKNIVVAINENKIK